MLQRGEVASVVDAATSTSTSTSTTVPATPEVSTCGELRRYPYPYRAMMAVCSDLDETPDRAVYDEIMRFLNTTAETSMGPGVGLEVGNTIYFEMPRGQFAYWNTDERGRAMVRALIRSGHIDALHSFGDLATTRGDAGRALDELERHGCRLKVWIDHAVAASNLGADIMKGEGDLPGSPVYHADLTRAFGIEYVWRGRVTSVIGQDAPRSLGGIFSAKSPLRAARTVCKEMAKGVLARCGNAKYAMHAPNEVLRPARLRDGQKVHEFLRSNPFVGGVENAATADGIARVLTQAMIARLVAREGTCILYTHLGKVRIPEVPFGGETRAAFRRLSAAQAQGRVLVTTTRRLLDHCRARREVKVALRQTGARTIIDLFAHEGLLGRGCGDATSIPAALCGLTVYVTDPARTEVSLNGWPVECIERNGPDHTGRRSVSLPWPRLEYPTT